jgi:hypothetical protein
VKVTIELPLDRFDQLRDKCDESSPEFSVLMNGCIDRRPNGNGNDFERFIEILCDNKQAEALLGLATRLCPEAIPAIKRALKFPSDH